MHGLGYAAALLLAAVFGYAAVAKLVDRRGTELGFRELGLSRSAAVVVPAVELALVLALVLVPGWGAAFALALLAAFTVFLTFAIRSGVRGGCNCFGNARRSTISSVDVVRNMILAAMAVVALSAPGATIPDVGAIATIVGAAVLAVGVLRVAEVRQ